MIGPPTVVWTESAINTPAVSVTASGLQRIYFEGAFLMRKAFLGVFAIIIAAVSVGSTWTQQGAWCETNCKALCTKIRGSAGAANCFAQIPCSNYVGKACAPAAVVNARYTVYCHGNPGKRDLPLMRTARS